jgi:hypothetical protein
VDQPCRAGVQAGAYYGALPAPNDALVLVLLQKVGDAAATTAGDNALSNYSTLAEMLSNGGNVECNTQNYVRKQITSNVTTTWSGGTLRRWDCYFPSQTILNLGSSAQLQQVQKLVVCYWPSVGSGGDAAILPLAHCDYFHVCDGTSFDLNLPQGYLRLAGA